MGVLLERDIQIIFVTSSSRRENGKFRKIVVESRPAYAQIHLRGCKEKYVMAWEAIYEIAKAKHKEDLLLEAQAERQSSHQSARVS